MAGWGSWGLVSNQPGYLNTVRYSQTLIAYSANDFIVCKSFAVNEFITFAYAKFITAKEVRSHIGNPLTKLISRMMTQPRGNPFQLSHTQFLVAGLLIGYISFVLWLGIRLIVLFSGAVIVVLAIASWYVQLEGQKISSSATSANLLEKDVFLSHISYFNNRIPDTSQSLWRSVQLQAQAIGQIATQIAQQESTFTPDLLETLHTVLDLVDQLVQALQVIQQVQTPRYRELAQQQLESSLTRLQQTHDQLQELHDQIALESLERRSLSAPAVISIRLQTLIAENERGILGN
ncbi:hypothetical protein [Nostoc favosum]|uniref:Uncharacterized protein n=1 Tax=Nostoc favosum CHAB5714 TaxID=2780399 RepID=A0ABS8I5W9_9NOSO|nr:hypothetical protein [Nostoc favosum]MCC5599546.1 hypothetical protein [Nostoc favosum CHAB5714]